MKEKIEALRIEIETAMEQTQTGRALYELKVRFQTELKGIMSGMKDLAKEDRPAFGKIVNEFKQGMEEKFDAREIVVKKIEMEEKYAKERIDISMPGKKYKAGALHPITLVKNELIDIFAGMGFKVFEGPEIETDYYNFTALNTPKDHPARDMQDTFYLAENLLLRTQTSAGQIRVMEKENPPIKILSPGRVFRSDDDATHSPMFHQMEGLVVDKGITLCDLQGMLAEFAKKMFTDSTKVRLRRWIASNLQRVVHTPQPRHLFGSTKDAPQPRQRAVSFFICSSVKVTRSSRKVLAFASFLPGTWRAEASQSRRTESKSTFSLSKAR